MQLARKCINQYSSPHPHRVWPLSVHCFAAVLTGYFLRKFFFFCENTAGLQLQQQQKNSTLIHAVGKTLPPHCTKRLSLESLSPRTPPPTPPQTPPLSPSLSAGREPAGSALHPRCLSHRKAGQRGGVLITQKRCNSSNCARGSPPPPLPSRIALYSREVLDGRTDGALCLQQCIMGRARVGLFDCVGLASWIIFFVVVFLEHSNAALEGDSLSRQNRPVQSAESTLCSRWERLSPSAAGEHDIPSTRRRA